MTAPDDRPDLDRVKAIFERALAVAEAGREAFVRDQCGSDGELAEMVLKLLGEHQQVQPTVEPPAPAAPAGRKPDTEYLGERPGDRIGPYLLVSKIGEGGMGIVYRAERTEPVKLTVALKVIKAGMDTREVIARFEVERQALALMNHPHVARVLDAGATKTGRPYFVMEYVPGVAVTEYCNQHRLTTRQRLELFMQACDAIQHAHQKGVIHRDIKPSNLLVSVKEGSPQLKVIDFGVAKAISQRLTEKTLFTEQGQLIGTPEYMSPEQAEMGSLDIDTRTDVYSLGVLLYELLSGALPFDPSELREAGFAEIQRIIREQEPAKPSTRLSGLGDESTDVARQHGSEPRTLLREIRGDLDWITMKALEKDRTRRYDTASGLAMDIHRYLLDEPVLAGPPTAAYRMRKFVRRNRGPVAAASMVLIVLIGAVIATGTALAREAEQRREAQRQASITQAVNDFFNNDLLAWRHPDRAQGHEVTVAELLDAAAEKNGGRFAEQPSAESQLRQTIGGLYFALGRYEEADGHLQRALELRRDFYGEDSLEAAETLETIAFTRASWRKEMSHAVELQTQVVRIREQRLGGEHPLTNRARGDLAMFQELQRGKLAAGLANPFALQMLASVRDQGETLKQVREHIERLISTIGQLWAEGKKEEAMALMETECEPFLASIFLKDRVAFGLAGFAQRLQEEGKPLVAEALATAAVQIGKTRVGERKQYTIWAMYVLGNIHRLQGRLEEAEPVLVRACELAREVRGATDGHTLGCVDTLAQLYRDQGRFQDAESTLLEANRNLESTSESKPRVTLRFIGLLAKLYDDWGKPEKAAEWRAKLPTEQEAVASDRPGQTSSE